MSVTTIDLATPPYVGPVPFTRGERLYGRDREAQELSGLLISERIVLLYSPSGAGKSSLLASRVIPELERREFVVRPVLRVSRDLPGMRGNRYLNSLAVSLGGEGEADGAAGASFEELLDRVAEGDPPRDEVLIFDQFEEILTLDPTDHAAKVECFRQIGRALLNRGRWALFAMREDYVAALDPYLRFLPTRLSATYRLDLLGARGAAQAITGPASERGVTFEPGAVERLVDDLRRIQVQGPQGEPLVKPGPYVEPVQLQVVCLRIWREWVARRTPDNLTITENDLGISQGVTEALDGTVGPGPITVNSVDNALRAYYDERVAAVAAAAPDGEPTPTPPQVAARERDVREWFDRHLITPEGLRGQVLQGYQFTEELSNHDIGSLVDAYLVRAERRGGRTWYELAHDRLLAPVRESNDRWRSEHLVPVQRLARLWEDQGQPEGLLLGGTSLLEAEHWASRADVIIKPLETRFLDASRDLARAQARERRRNRLIRILAIVATLGALVTATLAVLATIARNDAASRQLAALAGAAIEPNAPRALLYAAEALDRTAPLGPLPESRSALAQALAASGGTPLAMPAGRTLAVAISPDGRSVAAAGEAGSVRVWSTADLAAPPTTLGGHGDYVTALAFSPDGASLASASDDGTARVWATADLAAPPLVLAGDTPLTALAFSPDGAWLATGDLFGQPRLYAAADLAAPPRDLAPHADTIRALAFSPDSAYLATASADATARRWDLRQPDDPPLLLEGDGDAVLALTFSPDSTTIATGNLDGTTRLWDAATGAETAVLGGQGIPVTRLAFSPDNITLASGRFDGSLLLWSWLAPTLPPTPLAGHTVEITGLAFGADSASLYSVSGDTTLRVWTVSRGDTGQIVLRGHEEPIFGLAVGPGLLATAGGDALVRVWPTSSLSAIPWLRGPESRIAALRFDQAGVSLGAIAANGDGTSWALADPAPIAAIAPVTEVRQLAVTPDGRSVAAADELNRLWLWRPDEPAQAPQPLGQAAERVVALAVAPDGQRAAAATESGSLLLHHAASPDAPQSLIAGPSNLTALAFGPVGRLLAAGDGAGTVRLIDLDTPDAAAPPIPGHGTRVTTLAFSPDGRTLASADESGAIRLWRVERGLTLGAVLRGHDGRVQALAFSPDGRTLASGSIDRTVRLWELERTEATPVELVGHGSSIASLAFSPDGASLASGDVLGRVRLWPLPTGELRARACAAAGRNLRLDEWQRAFGSAPYRKSCASLPVSPSLVEAAAELAAFGQSAEAGTIAERAAALGADVDVPARVWGRLCRAGSLSDGAASVRAACDRAIALDPEDGLLYDWRALNHARTGNLAGAVADLERYLGWAAAAGRDPEQIALRERWANALRAGSNPYDEPALQTLRAEGES